jgi:staphylococcal nuclease domain-containing protein 1
LGHSFFGGGTLRLASKNNPVDEPGAFAAREWLRQLTVGKQVRFLQTTTTTTTTTRSNNKPGVASSLSSDSQPRVYGCLFFGIPKSSSSSSTNNGDDTVNNTKEEEANLAVECVRLGHGTPKAAKFTTTTTTEPGTSTTTATADDLDNNTYEAQLMAAYAQAKEAARGIHSTTTPPLVRTIPTDIDIPALVLSCTNRRVLAVVEYVFDGTRFRVQLLPDPALPQHYHYTHITCLVAGATSPRTGNANVPPEPYAIEAQQFATTRVLQRTMPLTLLGTDPAATSGVAVFHHPAGNIAVHLLRAGLARRSDWSVRLLLLQPNAKETVAELREAEDHAKQLKLGIWRDYVPPTLSATTSSTTAGMSGSSTFRGQVVEVQSGDTVLVLPVVVSEKSDTMNALATAATRKISLASIRAPRVGNERAGRADEPYAVECKERLRVLTIGKIVQVTVHYERDIPLAPNIQEKRAFGTVSVVGTTTAGSSSAVAAAKPPVDVAELLVAEGLAVTQRHRDDDPTSPRYDELRVAEAEAKAAGKGLHKKTENNDTVYKRRAVNDLTDPRKAKSYSGSLMRAGTLKAIVDFVFHGALFKMVVPSENCTIRFAPNFIRCPQPTPAGAAPGGKGGKASEPFGDECKHFSRLNVLQRNVEIVCTGVTASGIITGSMFVGQGNQRRDFAIDLLTAGLATLDQRKVDYGEVPKNLLDVVEKARESKLGVWSLESAVAEPAVKTLDKTKETVATVRLSEIRSGNHFFFQVVGDDAAKVMDESMRIFTQNNGTSGAPCDAKVGMVVAALFDDGVTGKSWYRAKIVERNNPTKMTVLFVDHGNLAAVPVATHLRPLDMSLGIDRIPPVAKEATLALTLTRSLDHDDGVEAARLLQTLCWGKDLTVRLWAPDETGKVAVVVMNPGGGSEQTVNAQLIAEGLAQVAKSVDMLASRMVESNAVVEFAAELSLMKDTARRTRVGMWRYGDVGDDDDE